MAYLGHHELISALVGLHREALSIICAVVSHTRNDILVIHHQIIYGIYVYDMCIFDIVHDLAPLNVLPTGAPFTNRV